MKMKTIYIKFLENLDLVNTMLFVAVILDP
jgi:hypothetical protein